MRRDEDPGAARGRQEEPGAARSRHEEPEGTRRTMFAMATQVVPVREVVAAVEGRMFYGRSP